VRSSNGGNAAFAQARRVSQSATRYVIGISYNSPIATKEPTAYQVTASPRLTFAEIPPQSGTLTSIRA
jgi:hypothetical protein